MWLRCGQIETHSDLKLIMYPLFENKPASSSKLEVDLLKDDSIDSILYVTKEYSEQKA